LIGEKQRVGSTLVSVALGGLAIGLLLPSLAHVGALQLLSLMLLAVIGEWLEVDLGAVGSITLRPVVAFAALWHVGPGVFLMVGTLPIILVRVVIRRVPIVRSLDNVGREAVALALSLAVLGLVRASVGDLGSEDGGRIATWLAAMTAYWVTRLLLQAVSLRVGEGMRFRTGAGNLARRAWAHAVAMMLAAVALGYIDEAFGPILTALAAVMLVEAYYPWKLLGEQGGVLITSLQMMAQAVDLKDPYTSNHSRRVSRYAVRLARAMGISEEEVERIRIGALMHDLGKIGISGRIIRKPGKLTMEEQALMREHSAVSANIIGPLEILGESARMVRHHHENWDGSGYPDGLKGDEIPLGSRVILVADAFDALVTDRPYRKGTSRIEAVEIIRRHSGTQFDPAVVSVLERVYISL
jgi:putative nucleotidyltransferase with HDIG domain